MIPSLTTLSPYIILIKLSLTLYIFLLKGIKISNSTFNNFKLYI